MNAEIVILLIVLYRCENFRLILKGKRKLGLFENKVSKKMYELMTE
jgi:hypothetical protein